MVLLDEIRKENALEKSVRCLVLGLDNAGKSTIVARFFGEDIYEVAPTVGFQIKTKQVGSISVDFWDVGGQKTLRPFWSNYYHAADALIWVVDSADIERLNLCKEELHSILKEERLVGAQLLILANKQDVQGSLSCKQISQSLSLADMSSDRKWKVASCSAATQSTQEIQKLFLDVLDSTRAELFPDSPALRMSDTQTCDLQQQSSCCFRRDSSFWINVPTVNERYKFQSKIREEIFGSMKTEKELADDIQLTLLKMTNMLENYRSSEAQCTE